MNLTLVLWAASIAAAYIFWPVIGKWSGAASSWVTTLVTLGSFLAAGALSCRQMIKEPATTTKMMILLLLAGLINGTAAYFYSTKVNDKTVPEGAFLATVYVFMVIFAPIVSWLFNGTAISQRQIYGMGVAIVAVYLLRK